MAAGPPGTIPTERKKKKSFHCVLLLITCLGSEGLNWVTVGAPRCRRGHGKCERQLPSVVLKDIILTIPPFTLHYGYYGQESGFLSLDNKHINKSKMFKFSPIFHMKQVAYPYPAEPMYRTVTYGCLVHLYVGSWSGLTFLPLAQFPCPSVCSCLDPQRRPLIGWSLPGWPVHSCMPAWSSLPAYIYTPPNPFSFIPRLTSCRPLIFHPVQLSPRCLVVTYFQVRQDVGVGRDFQNKRKSNTTTSRRHYL